MSAARETPISAIDRLDVVGPNAITVTESERGSCTITNHLRQYEMRSVTEASGVLHIALKERPIMELKAGMLTQHLLSAEGPRDLSANLHPP